MNKRFRAKTWWICFFGVRLLLAQNFSGGFNFTLPANDSTTQTYLPAFPAQTIRPDAFVEVRDGHFALAGQRIRFFGTNIVGTGAFPTPEIAPTLAGNLRKLGFNLVRFHHLDNPWGTGSLFEPNSDTRHLNPVTLDRFERLVYELKRNGIYANVNLHCSRTFRPEDGVIDADSLLDFGKGINLFDPQLLSLQKEYARQLLTHVNPYTGLALVDDPVMALVEIVNENSLYRYWREERLKPRTEGGILTRHYQAELDSFWISFLREKYSSTSDLEQAWRATPGSSGHPDLIADGGFEQFPAGTYWQLEQHSPASAVMVTDGQTVYEGAHSLRVVVLQTDGVGWHLQLKYTGLTLQKDSLYTITFAARADTERVADLAFIKDSSPWTYFTGLRVELRPVWQTFQFSFKAPGDYSNDVRLSFNIGLQKGNYWFDAIHFSQVNVAGLNAGESLEDGRVARLAYNECLQFSDQRVRDQSTFYLELQNHFFDEMQHYLKEDLGVRVPITGTNWNIGVADLAVQARLDYIDNHAYWDHPQFPHEPWSGTDWQINNTAMTNDENGGTIAGLFGGVPQTGKPFTVSEYNHPFPNRYQSEGLLFITAYGGFHDIDGLMFFDHLGGYSSWNVDFIDGYFDLHRNAVMLSLMPSCARAFREGYFRPSEQVLRVSFHPDDVLLAPKNDPNAWYGYFPIPQKLALQQAVRINNFVADQHFDPNGLPPVGSWPYVTDTDELVWQKDLLIVNTPRFIGLTGNLAQMEDQAAGSLTMIGATDRATLTWVSLDDLPLRQARKSLVTVASRIQNRNMQWDGLNTIHDDWGSSPTAIFPITVYLSLQVAADSLRVYPLDASGAEKGAYLTVFPDDSGRFNIILNQYLSPTLWFGIAAMGGSAQLPEENVEGVPEPGLRRIFPNPFNVSTTVEYFLPQTAEVRISIYDLRGRLVNTYTDNAGYGVRRFVWNGKCQDDSIASAGIYLIELAYAGQRNYRKCVLLR